MLSSHIFLASLPSPPSPVMFEVGPFALRYYGLCIALGIVVATWLTGRELERKGYDGTLALDSLFFIVPLGFVGARAYHVITDYELYSEDPFPGVFEVWNWGLGIYGAVIGGFLGLLIFARIRGISPLAFADAVAPGLVLAQAIGRWGNYFNQELFGRPSDLPWAIHIAPENRPIGYADAATFHPTFLYESIWVGGPTLRGPSEKRRHRRALREPVLLRTLLRRIPPRRPRFHYRGYYPRKPLRKQRPRAGLRHDPAPEALGDPAQGPSCLRHDGAISIQPKTNS
jgi:hypothetical protein